MVDKMKDKIKIADIPEHIYRITGKRVTRQTVYRWIKEGKPLHGLKSTPVKLQTKIVLGQLFSTKEYISVFLSRI